jgi:hypothetical protein
MKKRLYPAAFGPLTLLIALSACQPRSGAWDAGQPSLPGNVDAGSPTLSLQIEVRLADGGMVRAPLDPSMAALLPVTQSLDVTANLSLHNYRLRVLDELDRALASDDVPEETPGGLRYHISFLAPLRSGHRYTVLIDAQSGATLDNGSGMALNEQRFEFHTEGERDKDLPSKPPAKRRHRRTNGP